MDGALQPHKVASVANNMRRAINVAAMHPAQPFTTPERLYLPIQLAMSSTAIYVRACERKRDRHSTTFPGGCFHHDYTPEPINTTK